MLSDIFLITVTLEIYKVLIFWIHNTHTHWHTQNQFELPVLLWDGIKSFDVLLSQLTTTTRRFYGRVYWDS